MDTAAISLCRDNGIPIAVFKLMEPGNLRRVVAGEGVGSIVLSAQGRLEDVAMTQATRKSSRR